eukprot:m.170261 g.170261  ORF g.170261 m.170261 type:complete len:1090 (+) comp13488_c1_seq2:159-3428(+)
MLCLVKHQLLLLTGLFICNVFCGGRMVAGTDVLTLDNLADAPTLEEEFNTLLSPQAKDATEDVLRNAQIPVADKLSVHFHKDGKLFYTDSFPPPPEGSKERREARKRRLLEASHTDGTSSFFSDVEITEYTNDGIPILHSREQSKNKLYLDFNGHKNSAFSAWGEFDAVPFDTDGFRGAFSDAEVFDIVSIYAIVAEDFAPFDIDVTTEEPLDFQDENTVHVLITSSTQRSGDDMPSPSNGGVAFVGIFGNQDIAFYSPALVYIDNVVSYPPYIAIVASHEAGHNFGLSHDGDANGEYYSGLQGTTLYNSWGPIMGIPYDRALSQWSNGAYNTATNTEDDVAILASQLGYSCIDRGINSSRDNARRVRFPGGIGTSKFEGNGIICSQDTQAWWIIPVPKDGVSVYVAATPFRSEYEDRFGNIDIALKVYTASSTIPFATASPSGAPQATLTVAIETQGFIYVTVEGVGDSAVFADDYGSLGQYKLTGEISSPIASTHESTIGTTTTTGTQTSSATQEQCVDDMFEDNDEIQSATNLTAFLGEFVSLQVCAHDVDWYTLPVCAGSVVTFQALFTHSVGDVDMYLLLNGERVGVSQSGTDNEYIYFSVPNNIAPHTNIYLGLFGYDGSETSYQLRATLTECDVSLTQTTTASPPSSTTTSTTTAAACVNDKLEPNDETPVSITPASVDGLVLQICDGEYDLFSIDVCDNDGDIPLAITAYFSSCDGDLDIALLRGTLDSYEILSESFTGTSNEQLEYFFTQGEDNLLLVVYGYESASAPYTLRITGTHCTYGGSDVTTTPSPHGTCREDKFEPNDAIEDAVSISPLQIASTPLTICQQNSGVGGTTYNPRKLAFEQVDGDVDWYTFTHLNCNGERSDLSIDVFFSHMLGDVDAVLLNNKKYLIASSQSISANEHMIVQNAPAGQYYLAVYSYFGASNTYTLSISDSSACSKCAGANDMPRWQCKSSCPFGFLHFSPASRHPDFDGCDDHTHCECLPESCVGIKKLIRRKCRKFCKKQGKLPLFYEEAQHSGLFPGCKARHCTCLSKECEGTTPASNEDVCSNICAGGDYTFFANASEAGFEGCNKGHCVCN